MRYHKLTPLLFWRWHSDAVTRWIWERPWNIVWSLCYNWDSKNHYRSLASDWIRGLGLDVVQLMIWSNFTIGTCNFKFGLKVHCGYDLWLDQLPSSFTFNIPTMCNRCTSQKGLGSDCENSIALAIFQHTKSKKEITGFNFHLLK